jgi:hypothetical protein
MLLQILASTSYNAPAVILFSYTATASFILNIQPK